jgi:hypothetical protein
VELLNLQVGLLKKDIGTISETMNKYKELLAKKDNNIASFTDKIESIYSNS